MQIKGERKALREEIIRLKVEQGYRTDVIARELGLESVYVRKVIKHYNNSCITRQKFMKEWEWVYKWYRQYQERQQLRQQEIQRNILIPWDEYSKGTRWL